MYKVSVIIPVYNAEATLKSTINSVVAQTIGFENIELILVDDNSNDGSKQIIESYANKHDNIKPVFLKKNSGHASYPRNVGIENSTGEYLIFMDSDDQIFEDYCEILLDAIIENNVDIVNCNHASRLDGVVYIPKSIERIDFSQVTCSEESKMFLNHTAWGNIYKSSLIKDNEIKFPDSLHEDGVFSVHCLLETEKPVIELPNYPGYIYSIAHDESLSNNLDLNSLSMFLKGYTLCYELVKEHERFDIEHGIMSTFTNMTIFILLKIDNLDEGIKMVYEYEKSFDFEIILGSKPLELINSKIKNKQFMQAKILLKLMGIFYNNNKIRKYLFINYSNLKVL